MKKLYFLLFITLSLISFGQIDQKSKIKLKPQETELTEQQRILQVEEEFRTAKLEHNIQKLDEILADDYIGTNQFGQVRNKAQTKDFFTNSKLVSLTMDKAEVKLLSDASATLNGLQTENGRQMSFTRNYVKQNGQWRIHTSIQKYPEIQNVQVAGSYIINGFIRGAEGVAISLMMNTDGRQVNLNAAIVKDGIFKMEGHAIPYPAMAFLTTPGKRERASFYLENSEITVTGHLDSLSKVKVTGSKTQNELSAFLMAIDAFRGTFESKSKDMQAAALSKDSARKPFRFIVPIKCLQGAEINYPKC